MGGYFSSNADNRTNGNNATGNHGMYFGNQFTMGGESFQSMSPEAFLFGDISELSWLSRVPGSVPRVPNTVRHTNTVRCLVNVHKNSLRLIRHARNDSPVDAYHLSFTFDADCACTVVIHTFVEEAFDKHGNLKLQNYRQYSQFRPVDFTAGFNQTFNLSDYVLEGFEKMSQAELDPVSTTDTLRFPLAIEIRRHEEANSPPIRDPDNLDGTNHSQITYCYFEKSDNNIALKIAAQKINVDGRSFLLREIYGLERKVQEEGEDNNGDNDDDDDDESIDCVICMSTSMDTMVLPCRHLCLCHDCAEALRYQASKCPICRAPFHSLLQIQVAKREEDISDEQRDETEDQTDAPPGYRLVSVTSAISAAAADQSRGYISVHETDAETAPNAEAGSAYASEED